LFAFIFPYFFSPTAFIFYLWSHFLYPLCSPLCLFVCLFVFFFSSLSMLLCVHSLHCVFAYIWNCTFLGLMISYFDLFLRIIYMQRRFSFGFAHKHGFQAYNISLMKFKEWVLRSRTQRAWKIIKILMQNRAMHVNEEEQLNKEKSQDTIAREGKRARERERERKRVCVCVCVYGCVCITLLYGHDAVQLQAHHVHRP
jgi:hypothetical protein